MSSFVALREAFLSESLRLHGLGYSTYQRECSTCSAKLVTESEALVATVDPMPLYRCRRCGQFTECAKCCIQRHRQSPLHRIEVCSHTFETNYLCLHCSRSGGRIFGNEQLYAPLGSCTRSVMLVFPVSCRKVSLDC